MCPSVERALIVVVGVVEPDLRPCEAGLSASRTHTEERDGGMWAVEWRLLPQLFETAGAALRHTLALAVDLRPEVDAMRTRLDDTPEVLAEAAVFALAGKIGRQAASRMVKDALTVDEPLVTVLNKAGPTGIDWDAALAPDQFIQPAAAVARAIFAARGTEHING